MQKQARHRVMWNEQQARYEVQVIRPRISSWLGFKPDTAEWFAWLERIPSFRFHGRRGHFTARKETRKRGGVYWIAYRHIHGKLRKQATTCRVLRHKAIQIQESFAFLSTNDQSSSSSSVVEVGSFGSGASRVVGKAGS